MYQRQIKTEFPPSSAYTHLSMVDKRVRCHSSIDPDWAAGLDMWWNSPLKEGFTISESGLSQSEPVIHTGFLKFASRLTASQTIAPRLAAILHFTTKLSTCLWPMKVIRTAVPLLH